MPPHRPHDLGMRGHTLLERLGVRVQSAPRQVVRNEREAGHARGADPEVVVQAVAQVLVEVAHALHELAPQEHRGLAD